MAQISVVIPAYNAMAHLPATLAGLQSQSFEDWEAVVVDDGSSDGTADWLASEAKADSRIHPVVSQNSGPSVARNKGVAYSDAPLIAFLDADDVWPEHRLERLVEIFEAREEAGVLYSRVAFFHETPRHISATSTILPRPARVIDVLRANPTCTMSNVAVRRELFLNSGGFDPMIVHGEDREWLVRVAAAGGRIEGLNEVLAYYRVVDGGLSTDLEAMRKGWRASVATAKRLGAAPPRAKLREAEADHLRYLARRALRLQAPPARAAGYALQSLGQSPLSIFSQFSRAAPVLIAALTAPLMPKKVRRALFAGG